MKFSLGADVSPREIVEVSVWPLLDAIHPCLPVGTQIRRFSSEVRPVDPAVRPGRSVLKRVPARSPLDKWPPVCRDALVGHVSRCLGRRLSTQSPGQLACIKCVGSLYAGISQKEEMPHNAGRNETVSAELRGTDEVTRRRISSRSHRGDERCLRCIAFSPEACPLWPPGSRVRVPGHACN